MSASRSVFDLDVALSRFSEAMEAWRLERLQSDAPRGARAAEEMPVMAAQLGVDVADLEAASPGIVRAMEINCAGCAAKETCRDALEMHTAAEHYTDFCANARTFEAYLLDQ